MFCSSCGAPLVSGSASCGVCAKPIPQPVVHIGSDEVTFVPSSADPSLTALSPRSTDETIGSPSVPATAAMGPLVPGTAFGSRYHLTRLLGMGGMGAVYQAWDEELGVSVALKVIRPEIMLDPDGARDLERRFKRELLLARQV